jgi:hypothetical protein
MVAEARGLIAASSRILSSLDAVPAGVIPGKSANVDQLAALRARQRASTRRWWQDGRVAIAASLMLVAGVSSLVLRSNGGERLQVAADTAGSVPEGCGGASARCSTAAECSTDEGGGSRGYGL